MGRHLDNGAHTDRTQRQQAGGLYDRLRFAGLDQAQTDFLRANRETLLPHIENGLKDLFTRYQSFPAASRNFESERQIERLHGLMSQHWAVLSDARFDSLYAERVKVLSDTEGKMGLDPRWHVAGHAVVLEHLIAGAVAAHWPKSFFSRRKASAELDALIKAIIRTVMVDVEIAVSLRFNELRVEHAAELQAQREEIEGEAFDILSGAAAAIRAKDLTARAPTDVAEAYRPVAEEFYAALDQLREEMALSAGRSASSEKMVETVSAASRQAAEIAGDFSRKLVSGIEGLKDLTHKVGSNAASTVAAEKAVNNTKAAAEHSGEIVGAAINAMNDIENSAERIGEIIGVIDEIAFQTNLLALNAGIEAARAGDSGRGFAVVAQEVRALAQRSADAAKQIKHLVTETKSQVDSGVQMVGRTQVAISDIVRQVEDISAAVTGIAADARDHTRDLGAAVGNLEDIGRTATHGAEISVRAASEATDLHTVILELGNTIRSFRVAAREPQASTQFNMKRKPAQAPQAEPQQLSGQAPPALAFLAGLGG